jgi:anti-sigma-K factor RskA
MSDDPTTHHDDGTPLAAEYVLGTLDAAERRAFERRLGQEPSLRAEVEFWEQRLGTLAAEVGPVEPGPGVLARIEAQLDAGDRSQPRSSLWESLPFWRFTTAAAAALAAASLIALIYLGRGPVPGEPLVAKLDVPSGQAGFVAAFDPARDSLTIVPASTPNVSQRVLELWLIAPGEQPRSLGLIEPGRPVQINVPAALKDRLSATAALAVSLEPPGGSPTGLPTGPVIASGKLTKL